MKRPLLAAVAAAVLSPTLAGAAPLLYVALGDSTAIGVGAQGGGGYPDRIARRLEGSGVPVHLLNLGVSGATADDLRHVQLPRAVAAHPGFVTVCVGINDALRGRPLPDFARDLEITADAISRLGAPVVVSELPDVSRAPAGAGSPPALRRRLEAYNATIRMIAERHGFTVAPAPAAGSRGAAPARELFAQDGFHPSSRGYELWAEAMWPSVERALVRRAQARRPSP